MGQRATLQQGKKELKPGFWAIKQVQWGKIYANVWAMEHTVLTMG